MWSFGLLEATDRRLYQSDKPSFETHRFNWQDVSALCATSAIFATLSGAVRIRASEPDFQHSSLVGRLVIEANQLLRSSSKIASGEEKEDVLWESLSVVFEFRHYRAKLVDLACDLWMGMEH